MPKKSSDTKPAEKAPVKKAAKKAVEAEAKAVKKTAAKSVAAEAKPKPAKKTAEGNPTAAKSTAKPKKTKTAAITPEQLEEHIRVAAYYRWEQRGKIEGQHDQDWLDAEKEISR